MERNNDMNWIFGDRKISSSAKVIFVVVLLFVIFISVYFIYRSTDSFKYRKAVNLLENDKFNQASSFFSELSNYRNSDSLLALCQRSIGIDFLEQILPCKAESCFMKASSYLSVDSLLNECSFMNALIMIEKDQISEAYQVLRSIENHEEAQTLARDLALKEFISRGHHPDLRYGLGASRYEIEQELGEPLSELSGDGGDHIGYEIMDSNVNYGFPWFARSGGRGYGCSSLFIGGSLGRILGNSMQEVQEISGEPEFIGFDGYYDEWVMSYDLGVYHIVFIARDDTSEIRGFHMTYSN